MTTAPTTISNLDRTLTKTAAQLAAALGRGDITEASQASKVLDALLDQRLAQMALTTAPIDRPGLASLKRTTRARQHDFADDIKTTIRIPTQPGD